MIQKSEKTFRHLEGVALKPLAGIAVSRMIFILHNLRAETSVDTKNFFFFLYISFYSFLQKVTVLCR